MEEIREAEEKFIKLGRYIPLLENLLGNIKKQQQTEAFREKYGKTQTLLNFLKSPFPRNIRLSKLLTIENTLQILVCNYTKKFTSAQIKSERIDLGEKIKMENDFQSPESPPMFQDFKHEREPITIPTERRDSNSYCFDATPNPITDLRQKLDRDNRYDDYKRHHDRGHRERSDSYDRYRRSGSYERHRRSRSRSRSRDRKRYRRSRSHSRERKYYSRSNSHDKSYEKSCSPTHRRSPSRRRSPSDHHRRGSPYRKRSKSPYRHRTDRRDDRRYERDYDRSTEYDRNRAYDYKRNVKPDLEYDSKRESKWQSNSNVKQEPINGRENRNEPSTSATSQKSTPFFNDSAPIANRKEIKIPHTNSIKYERDPPKEINRLKPHATKSRFDSGPSEVEEFDFMRDIIKDRDVDEMERKTHNMFGRTEESKKLKKYIDEMDEAGRMIEECRNKVDDKRAEILARELSNELQAVGCDFGRNSVPPQNDVDEMVPVDFPASNAIDSRFETSVESNRTDSPRSPLPNQVPREERIALSDKYHRRPRIQYERAESIPENTSSVDPRNSHNQLPPQQDPRLRNRINAPISSPGLSFNQFMSLGNAQPMPGAFGAGLNQNLAGNRDAYQPSNRDGYPASTQRPFYDQYHQSQFPSRVPPHLPSTSNNFSPNASFGGNAPHRHSQFNQHANVNPSGYHEPPKPTYGEHRRRRAELERAEQERLEKIRKAQTSVTSTTITQTQSPSDGIEPNQESPTDSLQRKEADKEPNAQSSSNTAKKSYFDKAFNGNNWDDLPPPLKNTSSFKIPKLNKSNSNKPDDERNSPENDVTTSTKTSKDNRNDCSKTVVDEEKIDGDKKKRKRKRSKKPSNEEAITSADTTIIELEQPEESTPPPPPLSSKPTSQIILELLKDFAPEKVEDIRNILEATADSNDDAVTSSTAPVQNNTENKTANKPTKPQSKVETKIAKKTKPKRHANELDRLNADIRENIPGVLHATGKRSCTLNVPKTADVSPKKVARSAATAELKSDDDSTPEIEKPSARIKLRRNTTLESRPVLIESDDSSEILEPIPTANKINRRRGTICEERQRDNSSDGQEENTERIFVGRKPGPKSAGKAKRTETDPAVNAVRECRIVLEKVDESEEMRRITRSSKRKADAFADSEGNVSTEGNVSSENMPDEETVQEAKRSKNAVTVKNTDKTVTVKSRHCMICNKPCQFPSSHYANFHEGMEVYSARMSVEKSDKIRQIPAGDAIRGAGKLSAYCYYCEKTAKFERCKWIEHLSRHTGEYTRHCGKCNETITSINEKSCTHSRSDFKYIPTAQFSDTLYVYMCNFCNYTQSLEENMKNHISNMHDININILNYYTKIILIPNFMGRMRTAQTLWEECEPSDSKCDSEMNSDDVVTPDVFKSSNQDDDMVSDSLRLILTSNESDTIRPSGVTSIADRLNERFKKQKESSPAVKQEHEEAHTVIYRDPTEIDTKNQAKEKPLGGSLLEGDAVEKLCKIDVGKTEASTSGHQMVEPDDTDEQNWESCSDDDEEDISPSKSLNNLNRWIMTKGKLKPNKSRMRTKKRPDKSLLSSIIPKKEKPDEIIDLDDTIESKTTPIKPIELRPILADMKRVDNIAFSEHLGGQKYHCYIGDCDFFSINNINSLSNHLRSTHREPWTGYCHACDQQILIGNFSLKKEYDHLVAMHVPTSPTAAKLIAKVAELTKPPEEPPTPSKPTLIRLRRLSGDMLSGVLEMPQLNLIPPPSQQSQIVLPLAPKLLANLPSTVESLGPALDAVSVSDNSLKPWTNCMNTKSSSAEIKLKRDCSLIALFKCMAIDCIFTTSDKVAMSHHLSNHEDFAADSVNSEGYNPDDSSWLECCYCDEILGSCNMLVEHIISEHATSIFQCPYCFYRSVDQQNVNSHLRRYHSNEDAMHIFVCGSEIRSLTDDISAILLKQSEGVKEIQCPENGCQFQFIHWIDLNHHIKAAHKGKTMFNCSICNVVISTQRGEIDVQHFKTHGFCLCQCSYCSFGCNETDLMQGHLRDSHPNRLPYALVRIPNETEYSRHQASIAQFEGNSDQSAITYPPLTELQLNFMSPQLDWPSNALDPPNYDVNGNSSDAVKKTKVMELNKQEEASANLIKQKFGIRTLHHLLTTSLKRKPFGYASTAEPSTSNASPTHRLAASSDANTFEMIQTEIDSAARAILSDSGVEQNELYRCTFPACNWPARSDEREFLMHLAQHKGVGVYYTCYRCNGSFSTPVELKNHIPTHLKHRFFCFYCDMTGATQHEMNSHFENIHGKVDIQYIPLNEKNYDLETDIFVVCPTDENTYQNFISRLIKRNTDRMSEKKSFLPEEQDLLPKRQIFNEEIGCGRCTFQTKVRSNLIRHLRGGCNGQQAPVNPVPCLNTGERHFDKMRNLAASSNSLTDMGLGKFVPEDKRYVCGAKSCQYQTLTAEMLQQHIVTLHALEGSFSCPHCGVDLSSSNSATEILNHLRYHESRIYKCPGCPFVHYSKGSVEKHINESHPNSKERPLQLDRPAKKVEPPKLPVKPINYKWNCNICSTTFGTRALVKAHLTEKHLLSHQFNCAICRFSHDTKTVVKDHLMAEHKQNDLSKIKNHYDRVESPEDNTPIWRRDDPNRVKHIRGILFDDAEKSSSGKQVAGQSNSNPSIGLEIKPVKFPKSLSTSIVTTKRMKVTQDDSVLNSKLSKNTSNNDECFMILPPKEAVAEEVRPRPASLRQQPKRRFSTFIPSPSEQQPSTSSMQPPISLRLKRVCDPITDEQKMPPPKLGKLLAIKKCEKIDISTLNLIYMCNYCKIQVDSFKKVHTHWLAVHKKADDPIAKRFCYCITMKVKCVLCPADVTFQTIRAHMDEHLKRDMKNSYAFAKYSSNASDKLQCGICSKDVLDVATLQTHFRTDHPQSLRKEMKIEPLPMINDSILDDLIQQGDQGTFKCSHCHHYFSCRYDYERHHRKMHLMAPEKYEINGKDIIKYGCNVCTQVITDEHLAIDHLRSHVQQWFQCLYCPKKVQYAKLIQTHNQVTHNSHEIGFRMVNARENLNSFFQMTLTFSNGLKLIWGDVLNTKYGGIERLVKYINELNEVQRQQQLKTLKATQIVSVNAKSAQAASKIGQRRQTLL